MPTYLHTVVTRDDTTGGGMAGLAVATSVISIPDGFKKGSFILIY
jgi:hypothetical protein